MEKKEKENQNFSLTVWKKMLPFFRPYYRYFVTTVSLNVLLVLMDVGIPLFQSYGRNRRVCGDLWAGNPDADGQPLFQRPGGDPH